MSKDEIKDIYAAIRFVQNNAPIIGKEKDNPFFKSKYADLPSIWKAIHQTMATAGLAVVSYTDIDAQGNEIFITDIAGHGDKITSKSLVMLGKRTPQEVGSFMTYMRRYHLTSMLGLQVDVDDDGNASSQYEAPKPAKAPKQEWDARPVILEIGKKIDDADTTELLAIAKEKHITPFWKKFNKTQQDEVTAMFTKKKAFLEKGAKDEQN